MPKCPVLRPLPSGSRPALRPRGPDHHFGDPPILASSGPNRAPTPSDRKGVTIGDTPWEYRPHCGRYWLASACPYKKGSSITRADYWAKAWILIRRLHIRSGDPSGMACDGTHTCQTVDEAAESDVDLIESMGCTTKISCPASGGVRSAGRRTTVRRLAPSKVAPCVGASGQSGYPSIGQTSRWDLDYREMRPQAMRNRALITLKEPGVLVDGFIRQRIGIGQGRLECALTPRS